MMLNKFCKNISETQYNFLALLIATLLSKLVGFVRELLCAKEFGLSEEFDLYLSIAVWPSMIISLLLYAVPNVVIPRLKLNKEVDDKTYYSYFSTHFFWPYLFFLGVVIFCYLILINVYVPSLGLSEYNCDIALRMGIILSIYIFFEALFNLLTVMYNAKGYFILPAYLHLILQLSVIISLTLFGGKYGVVSIIIGLISGTILECVFFFLSLIKRKIIFFFKFGLNRVSNIFSSIIIVLCIELLGQLFTLFDRMYISYLPEGYVTALYYANIVKELPFSILGITFGTVVFPKITAMFQNKDYHSLKQLINKLIVLIGFISICISIFLILFDNEILTILFERGQFSHENILLTSRLLTLYVLGLPFLFIHFILSKVYYSMSMEKVILLFTCCTVLIKYILNRIFVTMEYFDGLALSTTIAFAINTIAMILYYYFFISRKLIRF